MNKSSRIDFDPKVSSSFEAAAQRTLTIDIEKYQAHLDDSGMSADRKEAFLRDMFSILMAFAELGYGVHPLQEVCGKPHEDLDCAAQTDSNGKRSKEEQDGTGRITRDPPPGLESQ